MRRCTAAAALLAAALLCAGCAADGPGDERPTQPPAHGGLAECLRANGVPDTAAPGAVLGPPPGVDPATWDTAMKACSTLAPGPAAP